ncbi:MAG: hypothetical protein Q7T29_10805 [Gallionella sp.]|nr:hypothetical protein [Gallionella sp.]
MAFEHSVDIAVMLVNGCVRQLNFIVGSMQHQWFKVTRAVLVEKLLALPNPLNITNQLREEKADVIHAETVPSVAHLRTLVRSGVADHALR